RGPRPERPATGAARGGSGGPEGCAAPGRPGERARALAAAAEGRARGAERRDAERRVPGQASRAGGGAGRGAGAHEPAPAGPRRRPGRPPQPRPGGGKPTTLEAVTLAAVAGGVRTNFEPVRPQAGPATPHAASARLSTACGEARAPSPAEALHSRVHGLWISAGTSRSERPFSSTCRPPDLRTYVLTCLQTPARAAREGGFPHGCSRLRRWLD